MKIPEITVMLNVMKPGDKVLIGFSSNDPEGINRVTGQLSEQFPGVVFVAIGGATFALVQPGVADVEGLEQLAEEENQSSEGVIYHG